MNKKSSTRAAIATTATLLLAASGVALSTAPAQAAYDCQYRICLWDDTNYGGFKESYYLSQGYVGDAINDKASSVDSRSSRVSTLYADLNWSGTWLQLAPGEDVGYLTNYGVPGHWPYTYSDIISSLSM
ncbi:peptidase inhibitor family I36 protein [Paenarthrobacter sp. NPDC089316]|uniref:peptidase inhibitor family I36 protein n=1 Tax=unclassified Paenarthrobacter TaxID=2634190 RepID=UPI00343D5325